MELETQAAFDPASFEHIPVLLNECLEGLAIDPAGTGLVLISRRPPQQKFTNFEEYMNAHGGATAPIEDHSDEV